MQRLIAAWSDLEQRVVDKIINEWHGWLRACVRAYQYYMDRPLFEIHYYAP